MKQNVFFLAVLLFLCVLHSRAQRNLTLKALKGISVGQLAETDYLKVRKILSNLTSSSLQDTIFIKYDFNRETCWDALDNQNDSYIQEIIKLAQNRVQETVLYRRKVSILRLREKGNSLNKLIAWDGSIIVDKEKDIFNLLFKKRSLCGSSIIILPDRNFILITTDPHMEVLNFTKTDIEQQLSH